MDYNNYDKYKNNSRIVHNCADNASDNARKGQELINKAGKNISIMYIMKDMTNRLNYLIESGRIKESDDDYIGMKQMIENFRDLLTTPEKEREASRIIYSYSAYDSFNNIYKVCGGKDV